MTTQESPVRIWKESVVLGLQQAGIPEEEAATLLDEQLKDPMAGRVSVTALCLRAWVNKQPASRLVLEAAKSPARAFARQCPTTIVVVPEHFLSDEKYDNVFTSGRPASQERALSYYCGPYATAPEEIQKRYGPDRGIFCADMQWGDHRVSHAWHVLFALLQLASQNWLLGCDTPVIAPQFFWRSNNYGVVALSVNHREREGRVIGPTQLTINQSDYAPLDKVEANIFHVF